MAAFEEARANAEAYVMADFRFLMGTAPKPRPADFGFNGGNMYTAQGQQFHVDALLPQTFPVHAGF